MTNKWKIYKDDLAKNGEILMGYSGQSFLDSGYFYAPYVPLQSTPVVTSNPYVASSGNPMGFPIPETAQEEAPKKPASHRSIYEDWQVSQDE